MKRSAFIQGALLAAAQVFMFLMAIGLGISEVPAGAAAIHPLWVVLGISLALAPLIILLLPISKGGPPPTKLLELSKPFRCVDARRLGRGMRRQRLSGQSIVALILLLAAFAFFSSLSATRLDQELASYAAIAAATLALLHIAYSLRVPGTILLAYVALAALVMGVALQVFVLWVGWIAVFQGPSSVSSQWSHILLSSSETILSTIVFTVTLPVTFWLFHLITFYGEERDLERDAVRRPPPSTALSAFGWWLGLQPFGYNTGKGRLLSISAFLCARLGILIASLSALTLAHFPLLALLPDARRAIEKPISESAQVNEIFNAISGRLSNLARGVVSIPELERTLNNNMEAQASLRDACYPPPTSREQQVKCNEVSYSLDRERTAVKRELDTRTSGASMLFIVTAATLLLAFGFALWWSFNSLGRQLAIRSYLRERESSDQAPFVFLRSFSDDSGRRGLNSIDALLYERASPTGPVLAIGRPGSKAPFGAARVFVSDEAWRNAALSLIREAKGLCVVVDESDGIRWELDRIQELNAQRKTLYFFRTTATADEKMRMLDRIYPGHALSSDVESTVAFRWSGDRVVLFSGRSRSADDAEAIIAHWLADGFGRLAKNDG